MFARINRQALQVSRSPTSTAVSTSLAIFAAHWHKRRSLLTNKQTLGNEVEDIRLPPQKVMPLGGANGREQCATRSKVLTILTLTACCDSNEENRNFVDCLAKSPGNPLAQELACDKHVSVVIECPGTANGDSLLHDRGHKLLSNIAVFHAVGDGRRRCNASTSPARLPLFQVSTIPSSVPTHT